MCPLKGRREIKTAEQQRVFTLVLAFERVTGFDIYFDIIISFCSALN